MSNASRALLLCLLSTFIVLPSTAAFAQTETESKTSQSEESEQSEDAKKEKASLINKEGWRTKFSLGYRTRPIGLALFNDTGYRKLLSKSESLLKKNTYIEAGVYTITSPAYFRTGAYVEAVPLSILQLRSTAQVARFYGTFGFLMDFEDQANRDWSIEAQQANADAGRGIAGNVFFWENKVTPRIKVGRIVALAEGRHVYLRSSVGESYYEPFYDMLLEPSDHIISIKPTLGVLPIQNANTYLLTALRFDRTHAFGNDIDTSQINGLAIWGIPKSWVRDNSLTITALYGYWLNHPNPREGTSYLAVQLGATFGAQ